MKIPGVILNLSVGKKITLAISIFILPIIFMGSVIVNEKQGLISFTKQ